MSRVDLFSPLAPEECVDRLRAGLLSPSSDVDGRVEYEWIRLGKRIFYRNSFQTFLRAKLLPYGTGTRLSGSLGLHPLVKGFVVFGLIFVTLVAVLGLVNGASPFVLLGVPAFVMFNLLMIGVGRLLVRGDDRRLMEFVTSAVQAEPVAMK